MSSGAPPSAAETRDPRLVGVCEVVGSFFVDAVYNALYFNAREGAAPGRNGLSDRYLAMLRAYALALRSPECFGRMAGSLHAHFDSAFGRRGSYAEFADRVVEVCVPPGTLALLKADDKDTLLGSLLEGCVEGLAAFAAEPQTLRAIVAERDRDPGGTIQALQDRALVLLLERRDAIHARFMAPERKQPAPADLDELKAAVRRLSLDRSEALKRAAAAEDRLRAAEASLTAERDRAAQARAAQARAEHENGELRRRAMQYLNLLAAARMGPAGRMGPPGAEPRAPAAEPQARSFPVEPSARAFTVEPRARAEPRAPAAEPQARAFLVEPRAPVAEPWPRSEPRVAAEPRTPTVAEPRFSAGDPRAGPGPSPSGPPGARAGPEAPEPQLGTVPAAPAALAALLGGGAPEDDDPEG